MSNGICHYTNYQAGGRGYYTSGCTDSTFKSTSCPQTCSKSALIARMQSLLGTNHGSSRLGDKINREIVYNASAQKWYCCGGDGKGGINCDAPTTESFAAPPASGLKAYFSAVGESVLSSSAAAASSSSSSSFSSSSASHSPSTLSKTTSANAQPATKTSSSAAATHVISHPHLSKGVAVGIGVGATVVSLAALGIVAWVFWRWAKKAVARRMQEEAAIEAKERRKTRAKMRESQVAHMKEVAISPPVVPGSREDLSGDESFRADLEAPIVTVTSDTEHDRPTGANEMAPTHTSHMSTPRASDVGAAAENHTAPPPGTPRSHRRNPSSPE